MNCVKTRYCEADAKRMEKRGGKKMSTPTSRNKYYASKIAYLCPVPNCGSWHLRAARLKGAQC